MVKTAERRIPLLMSHLHINASLCNSKKPTLSIEPSTCLVDEKIHIRLTGLTDGQIITLTCYVKEGGISFESRGVYQADKDGCIDNQKDPSLAGTFTKIDQMGLFWSLKARPGQRPGARLIKKDVTTPLVCTVNVYDGLHTTDAEIKLTPLTTATVHRFYKSPNVRRIPVTEGQYRGTIFVPQGKGPFPGLVDMYGSLVALVENRAALLASHGYATFAFSYLGQDEQQIKGTVGPKYIQDGAEWFNQQEYVDENRFGVIGLCYGGGLSLFCAAVMPKIKVVININGYPLMQDLPEEHTFDRSLEGESSMDWLRSERIYRTRDGIVISSVFEGNDLVGIPAWTHGAKVLTIVGEDDKQTPPVAHRQLLKSCPEKFRSNFEILAYPGAGHLIEPPYSPLCGVINPGKSRMAVIPFIKEEFRGEMMLAGGYPEEHAHAQEDAWLKILAFLHTHLQANVPDKCLVKSSL